MMILHLAFGGTVPLFICFVYWGQDRPVNKTDGRTPSQLALVGREACRSYLQFKEAEP